MTAPLQIPFYRKDVFEANSKDFEAEYGYRMEFTEDTTWKQVHEFTAFLKKLRDSGKDVPTGTLSTMVLLRGQHSWISSV